LTLLLASPFVRLAWLFGALLFLTLPLLLFCLSLLVISTPLILALLALLLLFVSLSLRNGLLLLLLLASLAPISTAFLALRWLRRLLRLIAAAATFLLPIAVSASTLGVGHALDGED